MQSKGLRFNIMIIFIILAFAFGGFYTGQALGRKKKIDRPIVVAGISVEGMDADEVRQTLLRLGERLSKRELQLEFSGKSWTISSEDISFKLDLAGTFQDILAAASPGFPFLRKNTAMLSPLEVRLRFTLDDGELRQKLKEIDSYIHIPPKNAFFIIDNKDMVKIIGGRPGRGLNFQANEDKIRAAIVNLEETRLYLETQTLEPAISTESLRSLSIAELVSSFSTRVTSGEENRNYNISLASEFIDGTLLGPGEIFSFNRVVGPRDGGSAFKDAPQIVGNELIDGIGGGICQVSTTLYNAALLADLKIVERYRHSKPVGYVPIGRDATVAYDYMDLKFQNTRDEHILIRAELVGQTFIIKIYGQKKPGVKVRLETREGDMVSGESYSIITTRIVEKDGREVRRQVISQDIYKVQN